MDVIFPTATDTFLGIDPCAAGLFQMAWSTLTPPFPSKRLDAGRPQSYYNTASSLHYEVLLII